MRTRSHKKGLEEEVVPLGFSRLTLGQACGCGRKNPASQFCPHPLICFRIFLTQESNWGLLHRRWILYQLSYQGCPSTKSRSYCLRSSKLTS